MKPLNFVSSKSVILKFLRDTNTQVDNFHIDAIEWIGEAMDAIGSYAQTVADAKIVKTSSHRTKVPAGTVSIDKVYFTRKEIPEGERPTKEDFVYTLPYGNTDSHPAFVPEDSEHPETVNRTDFDEDFVVDGGYIRTSFESDWILISYHKVQTCDDGYPLVPDNYEFQQALYWYLCTKMTERGWKHPSGLNYLQIEKRWLKYCQQARNDANMPSVAEMERFRDMWVSLLPPKAFEQFESNSDDAVDADNLIVDTFQRYTVSD